MRLPSPRLRQCNKFLAGVVIMFGLYLLIQPLLPQIHYFVRHTHLFNWLRSSTLGAAESSGARVSTHLITPRTSMAADVHYPLVTQVPKENMLIIPDIDVRASILEGSSSETLMSGIWHRPGTGTPDTGGNTVLVGHRFLYTSGPNTFYHLDKLRINDLIIVYWKGQRYTYIVDSSMVTSADAFEVEQSTAQPVLTLYTCTPLFTVDKRLVVRAHLITPNAEQRLAVGT